MKLYLRKWLVILQTLNSLGDEYMYRNFLELDFMKQSKIAVTTKIMSDTWTHKEGDREGESRLCICDYIANTARFRLIISIESPEDDSIYRYVRIFVLV